MLKIQIGDNSFTASLANNTTVDAFKELLADGPLTLNMSDYAGMEKGVDLGVTLPQNNRQMNTVAGDIILYQGRTFVIYYDTNSWSLTPIGKIQNTDADTLRKALGTGDVTVTLSLEGVFNGVGDTKMPFVISLCSMWGVRILFTFLCVNVWGLGLAAVWMCMIADVITRSICMYTRYRRGRWKQGLFDHLHTQEAQS